MESFSSVRNLAITIKRGAELVKLSRGNLLCILPLIEYFEGDINLGSPASVTAARSTINAALNHLDESINKADASKNSAMGEFAGHNERLLRIMGPETVKNSQRRVEVKDRLRMEYEKEQKLHDEIAQKKSKIFDRNIILSTCDE